MQAATRRRLTGSVLFSGKESALASPDRMAAESPRCSGSFLGWKRRQRGVTYWTGMTSKVGLVYQYSEMPLFPSSVEEENAFGLRQLHLPEEEIRKRTEEFLERFGLTKLRKRAPWSISGGEKKRTALAAVFAMEPEVLVIDEPICGLDEDAQEWVTEFLKEIRREDRTIIIGTHDKRLLAGLADAELHMNKYHRVEFTSVY